MLRRPMGEEVRPIVEHIDILGLSAGLIEDHPLFEGRSEDIRNLFKGLAPDEGLTIGDIMSKMNWPASDRKFVASILVSFEKRGQVRKEKNGKVSTYFWSTGGQQGGQGTGQQQAGGQSQQQATGSGSAGAKTSTLPKAPSLKAFIDSLKVVSVGYRKIDGVAPASIGPVRTHPGGIKFVVTYESPIYSGLKGSKDNLGVIDGKVSINGEYPIDIDFYHLMAGDIDGNRVTLKSYPIESQQFYDSDYKPKSVQVAVTVRSTVRNVTYFWPKFVIKDVIAGNMHAPSGGGSGGQKRQWRPQSSSSTIADPYSVLGVRRGDPWPTVKSAYRAAMMQHHPDRGGSEEMAKKVNAAYDQLRRVYGEDVEFESFEEAIEYFREELRRFRVVGDDGKELGTGKSAKEAIADATKKNPGDNLWWHKSHVETPAGINMYIAQIKGDLKAVTIPDDVRESDGIYSESSKVQSLVFNKDEYSPGEARRWAKDHGFKGGKVDAKANTLRLRQRNPGQYNQFRTIQLKPGVKATLGWEESKQTKDPEVAKRDLEKAKEDLEFHGKAGNPTGEYRAKKKIRELKKQMGENLAFEAKPDGATFEDAVAAYKEQIEGGLADGRNPDEFPEKQLRMGWEVEFEHSDDPMLALEIAMDHLAELPDYYTRLKASVEIEEEFSLATNELSLFFTVDDGAISDPFMDPENPKIDPTHDLYEVEAKVQIHRGLIDGAYVKDVSRWDDESRKWVDCQDPELRKKLEDAFYDHFEKTYNQRYKDEFQEPDFFESLQEGCDDDLEEMTDTDLLATVRRLTREYQDLVRRRPDSPAVDAIRNQIARLKTKGEKMGVAFAEDDRPDRWTPTRFDDETIPFAKGKNVAGIAAARHVREHQMFDRLKAGLDGVRKSGNLERVIGEWIREIAPNGRIDVTTVLPHDQTRRWRDGEFSHISYYVEVSDKDMPELVADVIELVFGRVQEAKDDDLSTDNEIGSGTYRGVEYKIYAVGPEELLPNRIDFYRKGEIIRRHYTDEVPEHRAKTIIDRMLG